ERRSRGKDPHRRRAAARRFAPPAVLDRRALGRLGPDRGSGLAAPAGARPGRRPDPPPVAGPPLGDSPPLPYSIAVRSDASVLIGEAGSQRLLELDPGAGLTHRA